MTRFYCVPEAKLFGRRRQDSADYGGILRKRGGGRGF